jgi:hypothetical protein
MAKNNLPIWCRENFSVRPELVEGWTEKFHYVARQAIHASTSSARTACRAILRFREVIFNGIHSA